MTHSFSTMIALVHAGSSQIEFAKSAIEYIFEVLNYWREIFVLLIAHAKYRYANKMERVTSRLIIRFP